jgi:hypothetical protein
VRNGVTNAVLAQPTANASTAVAFIADYALRTAAGASLPAALDAAMLHQRREHRLLMSLASRHQEHYWSASPISAQVDLGAEPAEATAQGFACLPSASPSSMLGRAHDRAIDKVHRPVQLSVAICSLFQRRLDLYPDASAPYCAGKSRQGAPIAKIQRMPLMMRRWG